MPYIGVVWWVNVGIYGIHGAPGKDTNASSIQHGLGQRETEHFWPSITAFFASCSSTTAWPFTRTATYAAAPQTRRLANMASCNFVPLRCLRCCLKLDLQTTVNCTEPSRFYHNALQSMGLETFHHHIHHSWPTTPPGKYVSWRPWVVRGHLWVIDS